LEAEKSLSRIDRWSLLAAEAETEAEAASLPSPSGSDRHRSHRSTSLLLLARRSPLLSDER